MGSETTGQPGADKPNTTRKRAPARKTPARKPPAKSQPTAAKTRAAVVQEAAERAKKALQLRTMRVSWDAIAKQCGYANRGVAYRAVQRELSRIPREAAIELRTVELEALDVAQRAINAQILAGSYGAIDRLLKIMDARAKLTGLYDEVADTGVAEVKQVLAAWVGQVAKTVDDDELDDELEAGEADADDVDD